MTGPNVCSGALQPTWSLSSDRRKPLPPAAIIERAKQQIVLINQWTDGLDVEAYVADELRRYAVERAFIALGEAVGVYCADNVEAVMLCRRGRFGTVAGGRGGIS